MNTRMELFSAQCPCCEETIRLVKELAGPGDELTIQNMHEPAGQSRARELGVVRVPAVAVDGRLASCCSGSSVDGAVLRSMGVGS